MRGCEGILSKEKLINDEKHTIQRVVQKSSQRLTRFTLLCAPETNLKEKEKNKSEEVPICFSFMLTTLSYVVRPQPHTRFDN